MKHLVISAAVALAGNIVLAQDNATTDTSATVITKSETATTATVNNDNARTTISEAMARNFTPEAFQKRWEMEKTMYKEAGISDDKIQKLHDINKKVWDSRATGEKVDFQQLSRERSEILGKEEMEKLRNARRSMIQQKVNQSDNATTAPR